MKPSRMEEPTGNSNWKAKIESLFMKHNAGFLRDLDFKVNPDYWPEFINDCDTDLSWPVWLEIEGKNDALS